MQTSSLNEAWVRRLFIWASYEWQPELRFFFCRWIILVCQEDALANLCTSKWFLRILVRQISIHTPLNLMNSVLVGDCGCIITQLLATTMSGKNLRSFLAPFLGGRAGLFFAPELPCKKTPDPNYKNQLSVLLWKWNMSWCYEGNIEKH